MPTKVAPSAAVASNSQNVVLRSLSIAVVDRERHRARAADQHEGHDRNRTAARSAADIQREDEAGFGHGTVVEPRTVSV
jgi:hypothetical protein